MITSELEIKLKSEGYYEATEIPGRGICAVRPFMYTYGLCCGIDESGYTGRYCYHTAIEALLALKAWNGEGDPSGNWIKYKGRPYERSNPNNKEVYE